MIHATRKNFHSKLLYRYICWWTARKFKLIQSRPFEPKPGHSILLLCNHFSWWDGFLAYYITYSQLMRKFYIMMQHDQFNKLSYLKNMGAFSLKKGSRETIETLAYTAKLLDDPENLVVVFPQGELCSNHITYVHIEKGIERIIKQIKGPCQIVYSCALIDYFESLKPSVYFHLFDCGTANEITFDELTNKINTFHQQALKAQVNVEH